MDDKSGLDGPLFDSVHLSGFTGGDMALEHLFLSEFCRNARKNLQEIEACTTLEDWRAYTHKLKGAARAVGVWSIAAWCEAAEHTHSLITGPERQALFDRITKVIERLEQHVASLEE